MGLNLNIRRVVFSTMQKFDGEAVRRGRRTTQRTQRRRGPSAGPRAAQPSRPTPPRPPPPRRRDLSFSEIKQIAGRAGRYRSVFPRGLVTAMDSADLDLLRAALASPSEALTAAGIFPSVEQLATFVHADSDGAQLLSRAAASEPAWPSSPPLAASGPPLARPGGKPHRPASAAPHAAARPAEGLPGALRAFRDRARTAEHYSMRDGQEMLASAPPPRGGPAQPLITCRRCHQRALYRLKP